MTTTIPPLRRPWTAPLTETENDELRSRLLRGVIAAGKLGIWSVPDENLYRRARDMQAEISQALADLCGTAAVQANSGPGGRL